MTYANIISLIQNHEEFSKLPEKVCSDLDYYFHYLQDFSFWTSKEAVFAHYCKIVGYINALVAVGIISQAYRDLIFEYANDVYHDH